MSYLLIFVIRENKIFISMIFDHVFYFFCSWTVPETPLYDPLLTVATSPLLSSLSQNNHACSREDTLGPGLHSFAKWASPVNKNTCMSYVFSIETEITILNAMITMITLHLISSVSSRLISTSSPPTSLMANWHVSCRRLKSLMAHRAIMVAVWFPLYNWKNIAHFHKLSYNG